MAEEFTVYVANEVKFRHKAITFEDLYVIARNFLLEIPMNREGGPPVIAAIVEKFRLAALEPPVDLNRLAKQWGVTSIEEESIRI